MNRYNSTIKIKTCKNPFCGRMPKIGFQGYCGVKCMPDELAGLEKFKKSNVSDRNATYKSNLSRKVHSIQNGKIDTLGAEIELNRKIAISNAFFEHAKTMTGVCSNCGGKTCKGDIKYQKFSQAHILGKALFPSVAANLDNFVELCHFGNSCHGNFDNNGYEYAAEKMPKLWEIIVQRVTKMIPLIKEKSKLPDILKQEVNY